jgi:hypothetical protein
MEYAKDEEEDMRRENKWFFNFMVLMIGIACLIILIALTYGAFVE